MRGKFRHTSNFGAGSPDTGNFNSPNPWFLVDNQSCETLADPNLEQYQFIRDKQKEQGLGWISILKEALAPRRMHTEQQMPQIVRQVALRRLEACWEAPERGPAPRQATRGRLGPVRELQPPPGARWESRGTESCVIRGLKFSWGKVRHQLKSEMFPTKLSPYEPPPPWMSNEDERTNLTVLLTIRSWEVVGHTCRCGFFS